MGRLNPVAPSGVVYLSEFVSICLSASHICVWSEHKCRSKDLGSQHVVLWFCYHINQKPVSECYSSTVSAFQVEESHGVLYIRFSFLEFFIQHLCRHSFSKRTSWDIFRTHTETKYGQEEEKNESVDSTSFVGISERRIKPASFGLGLSDQSIEPGDLLWFPRWCAETTYIVT